MRSLSESTPASTVLIVILRVYLLSSLSVLVNWVRNMVQSENLVDTESACSSASLNGDITAKRVKEARKKRKHHRDGATAEAGPSAGIDGSLPTKRRHSVSKPARDLRDEPEKRTKKKRKTAAAIPEGFETRSPSPVIDFDGLSRPSKGTRERLEESPDKAVERMEKMCGAVRTLLECVGEDPDREGIANTPERYAKAMLYFTKGYQQNVADIVNDAIFHEGHNEMVIVKDIDIFSMCEHHLVPFTGKVRALLRGNMAEGSPALTQDHRCTSATSLGTPSSACQNCRVSPRCSAAGCRCRSA